MKKFLVFILTGAVIMFVAPVRASSIGSPETNGKGKFGAGAEWSYIFNRGLSFRKATRPNGHDTDRPINFKIVRGANAGARFSYGIFDVLDVYLKLGTANYDFNGDVYVGDLKKVEENISARNAFLYGAGLKSAYEFKCGWIVGCDLQYLTSAGDIYFRATSTSSGAVTAAKYNDCRIQEWNTAFYIAKKIARFIPYLGARYSDMRLDQAKPTDPKRWNDLVFVSKYNVGVFTGIDWDLAKNFKLNLEVRFVDETAASVGGTYRF